MMKKYLITEEQLNKTLSAKVTKGIGLKIRDGNGEYYKSIIKTFDSDEDYNDWEDNLKEGTLVIGSIDIDEPQESLQESTGDVKKKGRDIQMLERLMKKKYPFITGLEVNEIEESFIYLNIHFDLNMFYDLTKTSPPQKYIENEWWDMLEEKAPYFMRYVESEEKDNVNKISRNIEKDLNQIYKVLPKNVIHTKYESWDDDHIDFLGNRGQSFYKQWRDDKEPMDVGIDNFYPQLDVDKLLLTISQGD
jgi:hypothetical protein